MKKKKTHVFSDLMKPYDSPFGIRECIKVKGEGPTQYKYDYSKLNPEFFKEKDMQEENTKEKLFLEAMFMDIRKIQQNIDTLTRNCQFIPRDPIEKRMESIQSFMSEFQYAQYRIEELFIYIKSELQEISKLNKKKKENGR